ncbi:hypothetical protein JCM8208_003639 [Rhodotorula glutinis]
MPRRKAKTSTSTPDPHRQVSSTSGDLAELDKAQMATTASSGDGSSDDGRGGDSHSKQKAVDGSDTVSPKPKKRKRMLDSPKVNSKVTGMLRQTALFKLPFELLDSIFSQVGSGDLLSLTKTCKVVRAVLLGAAAAPIWKAAREQRELPLPSSMTEQQLAELLHGKKCYACGSTYATEVIYAFRCRLCRTCNEKEIVLGTKVRRQLKGVHPHAVDCVRYVDNGKSWDNKPRIDYLVRDLWAVSSTLYELAEQDEVAEYALEAARLKTSTRSRRVKTVAEDLPRADQLETFVMWRKEWVKKELEEIAEVSNIVAEEELAARRLIWAEEARVRDEERKKVESFYSRLRAEHDWTDEQIRWYRKNREHKQVPDVALDDDPDAWDAFREWIQDDLERASAESAARVARDDRYAAVEPFYKMFANSLDDDEKEVLPPFDEMSEWPVLNSLWEPADTPTINGAIWRRALPAIRERYAEYVEEIRVEAIRAILVATTGVRLSTLSTDPSDYPEDEYDDNWFERPTALFLGDLQDHPVGKVVSVPLPYPETLSQHVGPADRRDWFADHIDEYSVLCIRFMLDVVGVKEENADAFSLAQWGSMYRWRNNPYRSKKERTRRYNWVELLYALRRRGPSITNLRTGRSLPKITVGGNDDDEQDEEDEEGEEKSETSEGEEDEEDE